MVPYIIFFLIINFGILIMSLHEKFEKAYIIVIGGILTLFSGFRYYVGTDFETYHNDIEILNKGIDLPFYEPGYKLLVESINKLNGKPQLVFFLFSLLTVYFVVKFISFHSERVGFSLLIYFLLPPLYMASFNQIRQFLAVAIFLYALRFVVNKSLWRYALTIILASTIHVTAILMLPLYFILRRNINTRLILVILAVYIFVIISMDVLFTYIGLSTKYLQNNNQESKLPIIAFLLPVFSLCLLLIKRSLLARNKDILIFINLLFIGSIISITPLFIDVFSGHFARMTSYFTFSIIIIIPTFILFLKDYNLDKFVAILLLIIFSNYFIYTVIVNGIDYHLIPYKVNFKLF